MMDRMARTGGGARGALASLALLLCLSAAGCTAEDPDEPPSSSAPESAALRVRTVHVAGSLTPEAQAEAESAVGDVLSGYVVRAFLGDYPREDFVGSFESFTGDLARDAARDIDQLTANSLGEAESVRATRLAADLSFVAEDSDVVGATASVRFAFEATVDGEARPLSLRGRLMLVEDDGAWSVFGYDVRTDTGDAVEAGVTP
jgi:hypothetical protein